MGNGPSLPGLQRGRWPKLGSYGKNQIFGPKNKISGPKKEHFLTLTKFWPRQGKVVQTKKYPFPKYMSVFKQSLGVCFFGKTWIFGQRNTFPPNVKVAVSPYFRLGPSLLSLWVNILIARTVPPSFVDDGPKLRVLIIAKWHKCEMAKKRGEPKKWPIARKRSFFLRGGPNGKVGALGILVICHVDKNCDYKTNKLLFFPKYPNFWTKLHIFVPKN